MSLLGQFSPITGDISTTFPIEGHCIFSGCSPVVSSLASGHMVVCLPVRVTLDRLPLMAHVQGHTHVTISQNILENTGNLRAVTSLCCSIRAAGQATSSSLHSCGTSWTPDLGWHSVCRGTLVKLPSFLRLEVERSKSPLQGWVIENINHQTPKFSLHFQPFLASPASRLKVGDQFGSKCYIFTNPLLKSCIVISYLTLYYGIYCLGSSTQMRHK